MWRPQPHRIRFFSMTTFSCKIHENQKGTVVAACDTDLLGETVQDNGVTLHVSDGFYGGEETTLEDIVAAADRATTSNFVGEDLITALIEEDVVSEEEVHYVDSIPHVQLFFV